MKHPSKTKKRNRAVKQPVQSPFMGLLGMLTVSDEEVHARVVKRISDACTQLSELARTRDVPHEVFEIMLSLRDAAAVPMWFEQQRVVVPHAKGS